MGAFSQIKDALVFAFAPPAVIELGNSAGFDFYLQDNAGLGHDALTQARNQFLGAAAQNKLLANVRPNGQEDAPQLRIDIDQNKASALGLSLADINSTLSTAWGSQYVNDFIDRGRVKRVYHAGRRAVSHGARRLRRAGTCATTRARWCRSRPSPARTGTTARRGSSATTAPRR